MTLAIVQFTRTSTIDPFSGDPMTADIAYSGAAGAVTIKFGGLTGPVVGTGPSGAATVSCTFPSYATALFINDPTVIASGFFLDDGTTQIGTVIRFDPLEPAAPFLVTPLGGLTFSFTAPLYDTVVGDIASPQASPYDFWLDQPSMAFTPVLDTAPGGAVYVWDLSAPWMSLLWDFGDGNTSSTPNPTHTYAVAGVYDVRLTADYSPFLVAPGADGRTGPHTISRGFQAVVAVETGWYVNVIGMGQ